MRARLLFVLAVVALMALMAKMSAQTPQVAPREGYRLYDETKVGVFAVQRWVSAASPEVSPAGTCECMTVVYLGNRKVFTAGEPGLISATSIVPPTGLDVNGDRQPDLVVNEWSGGAHCCYSTEVLTVGDEVRSILKLQTGNCGPGDFVDLDGNGQLEFMTCDDGWANNDYCSFASSPFPKVVFAYDAATQAYQIATPTFGARFPDALAESVDFAKKALAENAGKDRDLDKCIVLGAALDHMYRGGFNAGLALLRDLYRHPDRDAFERETVARVKSSGLWIEK